MDMQMVTKDLENRILAGKAWLESGEGLTLDGPQLRKYPTKVQLARFLDTPGRMERYGLGFVVTIETPRGPRRFQLNVRIKPNLSTGPKADSDPYVVTYVVIQSTGADDEIEHEHFSSPKHYANLSKLSVQDWYMNWLSRAFETESGKFFSNEVFVG
jgi:hypothetical protein